jgi:DNA-binding HxlR family transcriptional regulator
MTDKEIEMASKLGASTFLLYSYLKRSKRSSTLDITLDIGLSDKTIIQGLKRLTESKVIERKMITNTIREIHINHENNWNLQ